jgi:hypothetical protein
MSNKFYITIQRIYNASPPPNNYKLYLSKFPDFSNLREINLEVYSITNYIAKICRDIHWAGSFKMLLSSQPSALIIKQGDLTFSPELVQYLHRNVWQDLFKGYVPPPSQFSPSEPIPDLLKDL